MYAQQTDLIAFEAARLIDDEQFDDINAAIRAAAHGLGLDEAPLPSAGRVRKHLQALTMATVGADAYEASVKQTLETAEQMMTLLDMLFDDVDMLLVGRGAKGHVDGPTALHVRLYTRRPLRDVADALVEHGYDEPRFETADTRLGRLDRIHLADDGAEIVMTRCMPEHRASADRDLFKDEPIATLDLEGLRERII